MIYNKNFAYNSILPRRSRPSLPIFPRVRGSERLDKSGIPIIFFLLERIKTLNKLIICDYK